MRWESVKYAEMVTTRASRCGWAGRTHVFDSFECAIHALAPSCAHCNCKVIGHGIEAADTFYCCANCAGQAGIGDVRDRSAQTPKPE